MLDDAKEGIGAGVTESARLRNRDPSSELIAIAHADLIGQRDVELEVGGLGAISQIDGEGRVAAPGAVRVESLSRQTAGDEDASKDDDGR
jgi:hypothetical protein